MAGGHHLFVSSHVWIRTVRYSISGNLVLPQPASGDDNRCNLFDYIRCPQLTSYWHYDYMQHWGAV